MFSLSLADVPFVGSATPIQRALAVLRKFGTDAHVWLPGVGSINGLQTANYLLSDASTGLAPVDQYVGRASDALGGLGVDILGTVWQVSAGASVVSGTVTLNNVSDVFAYQDVMTPGATYKVDFAYTITSGASGLYVGTNSGTGENIVSLSALTGSGVFSGVFRAGYARFVFRDSASGCVATFTNISVREVTGIDATQPTTANKPKLVRGAVNLLTYSSDFTNAAWGVSGITKSAGVITEDTGTSIHALVRFTTWPAATASTAAFVVSAGTASKCWIGNASAATATCFDLTTGVVEGNIGSIVGSITPLGGGQYLIAAQHTAASSQTFALGIYSIYVSGSYTSTTSTGTSRTLNVASGGLFQGTYTAAQIQALGGIPLTTTAPASTALGPWAWQFDGSNDSLALLSVPFQMSDDHCVIAAGVNYASTGDRYLFDGGNTVSSNAMVCSLAINNTQPKVYWRDDAVVNAGVAGVVGSIPIGSAAVISARKRGTSGVLRLNGLQVGVAATVTPGVTTCTHSAIGVRAFPGNYFNGNIGPVIAIKGTVSDSDLLLLEKLVGALSGVAIP